jgi:hypothetical protein
MPTAVMMVVLLLYHPVPDKTFFFGAQFKSKEKKKRNVVFVM